MSEMMIEEKPRESSLRDLYYTFFQHKRKMLVFFCVVMAVVIAGTFLSEEVYRSEAMLLVRLGRESVRLDPTATTGQTIHISQSRESELNSELEILKSRELVEKIIDVIGVERLVGSSDGVDKAESLDRHNSAVLKVMDKLEVKVLKNSNIISVSYEAGDPKLAQEVVTKLIELYLEKHIAVHQTPGSYKFFIEQSKHLRNELAQSEDKLWKLKNETGVSSVEEQREILLNRIGAAELEMETTEAELAASRAKVEALRKTLQPTLLDEQATLLSLESKLEVQKRQLADMRAELKVLNDSEVKIAPLMREIDRQEADYLKYSEHLEQARIDQALEADRIVNISVVQLATLPLKPIRPRKVLNLALGFIAGVFGAIGLALFCAYLDHSIKTPEEAEDNLQLFALASIPFVPNAGSNGFAPPAKPGEEVLSRMAAKCKSAVEKREVSKQDRTKLKAEHEDAISRLEADYEKALAELKEKAKAQNAEITQAKHDKKVELAKLDARAKELPGKIKAGKADEKAGFVKEKARITSEYKKAKAKADKKERLKLASGHNRMIGQLKADYEKALVEIAERAKIRDLEIVQAKHKNEVELAKLDETAKKLAEDIKVKTAAQKREFAKEKSKISAEYKRAKAEADRKEKARLEAERGEVLSRSEQEYVAEEAETQNIGIVQPAGREYYETFRERVLLACSNGSPLAPYVLGIVGCHRGQGTSTVTANLAATLSRHGDGNVLLIDSNVCHPSVHKIFEANLSPGLTDVLTNGRSNGDAIQSLPAESLDVLSAGTRGENFSKIFDADGFGKMLKSVKSRYRFVIVDIPALNETSSATRLASLCDGVVLVIEAERLRREVAQRAKGQLRKYNANILGVVLNKRRFRVPEWLYSKL